MTSSISRAGRQAAVGQRGGDLVDEARLLELGAGDVDAQVRRAGPRSRPGGRPRAGPSGRAGTIRPVSSAERDELARAEQAARRGAASARAPRSRRRGRGRGRRSAGSAGPAPRSRSRARAARGGRAGRRALTCMSCGEDRVAVACRRPWRRTSRGRRCAAGRRRSRWRRCRSLARRCRRLPSSMTGAARTSNRRSTRTSASPASGARIANSSPPRRATVSPARSALRRRSPQISSRRSPAAWPSESLTRLKSSRSRKATTAGSPAASVSAMRCSNSGRFGRPVSESWKASRRSSPSRSAAAAGAVEQREQRGQADHASSEHHDDRADPGHAVAAVGELRGCGRRRGAGRGGCARSRRWRSIGGGALEVAARISANSSSISGW